MTTATDTDIQQIKDLITAGNIATQKQIADLTLEMRLGFANVDTKFTAVREEIRVGFANVDTKFAEVKGDIKELRSEIKALDGKLEEKTKNLDQRLGSGEFTARGITIGLTVTVVGGLLLTFGKILFFTRKGFRQGLSTLLELFSFVLLTMKGWLGVFRHDTFTLFFTLL